MKMIKNIHEGVARRLGQLGLGWEVGRLMNAAEEWVMERVNTMPKQTFERTISRNLACSQEASLPRPSR